MFTLLLRGTLPDLADICLEIAEANPLLGIIFMLFVTISFLTLMNMMTGILVNVVTVVAAVEKETLLVRSVKSRMLDMLDEERSDDIATGALDQEAFETLLVDPDKTSFLSDIGVDVVALVDYVDMVFKDPHSEKPGTIPYTDFMELVLQLRGRNTATVKDLMDFRKIMITEIRDLETKVCSSDPMIKDAARDATPCHAARHHFGI